MNLYGPAVVLRGDARTLPLPDAAVDLIVTSPPYFGLRSYQDGGAHYEGQVGDEATPAEYLDALTACTAEWVRVLKPGGSIFVNLGDKYDKRKSLGMLPQRYALRCIDELGLIARAEIVWAKPNGLPESVTDRVRRSHEVVFHFVKQPRYYAAVDEIREQYSPNTEWKEPGRFTTEYAPEVTRHGTAASGLRSVQNPLGKLPGSVWSIPTSPLRVPESLGIDHFAAYPPELVRRIVLGWSPRQVCTVCGEGRRPVVNARPDERPPYVTSGYSTRRDGPTARKVLAPGGGALPSKVKTLTGYACACPDTDAPSTPGVVLDPFGGTGTTALVASTFGRVGITVDLSADYCRLVRWRTTDPGERARALDVPRPALPVTGQLGLFDGFDA